MAGTGRSSISTLRFKGGAYYYWYADDDPIRETQRFLDLVKPKPGDLLAIDLEDQVTSAAKAGKATGNFWAPIKAWLDAVENSTGHKAFIYTSPGWWNYYMCKLDGIKRISPAWSFAYPLWVAHYTDYATPQIPLGFSTAQIWQYGSGPVKGCGISAGSNPNTDLDKLITPLVEIKKTWMSVINTIQPVVEPTMELKVDILWKDYQLRKI